ncbi:hypothetical protein NKR23_g10888 [Pleurostoma richardsiae]|uniref:Uncharacterized protein n=1 Tax=Pleurostoma richardsiae TaxID=41990 RepID=A0AA38RDE5_9PEZI|nr:hypothetical protein NKR23_g10888 [Pleurostoma richardsiae]
MWPVFAIIPILLASRLAPHLVIGSPLPTGQDGAVIEEDTGQVSIQESPTDKDTPADVTISATFFDGVPGPKKCRGSVMAAIHLPPPEGLGLTTASTCYNLPSPAGCANFVANKVDGCEATLFAEPSCRSFTNLAVFTPEITAFGGVWRSVSVRCGVPEPDPASLGAPPLADMIMKQTPKSG